MNLKAAKKMVADAAKDKVSIVLAVSRAGPNGGDKGATIKVGFAEAARMNKAGQLQIAADASGDKQREAFAAWKAAEAVIAAADDKAGAEDEISAEDVAADEAAAAAKGAA
jgi:hypothetical protein